jgi:hypothetical protein
MKKHVLFFVLLLSLIVSACKTKCSPLTASEKADIEKQILEIVNKLIISVEKLDIDSFSTFFSSNEFSSGYCQGSTFQSKQEWVDDTRVWFNMLKSAELDNKIKVTVLSADLVLADRVGNYQVIFKDDRISRSKQALSYIFKKEAAGWKIIHVHESSKAN